MAEFENIKLNFVVKVIYPFIKLLHQAEGKNKIFALFQYVSKFFGTTIIYSIDTTILLESGDLLESVYKKLYALEKIEKSISNGRKIFRFLKFIDDLKKLSKHLKSNIFNSKTVFDIIITLFSTFYHFLENLVLLSNLGILEQNITEGLNWKTGKNFFSLLRSAFKLISLLMEMSDLFKDKWKDYKSSLMNLYSVESESEKSQEKIHKEIKKLLKADEKYYEINFLMVESLMKLLMRINSLKLEPVFSHLHPLLISLCGVVYCLCGIRKRISKINKEETNKANLFFNKMKSNKSLENIKNLNPSKANLRGKRSFEHLVFITNKSKSDLIISKNYYDGYYIEFGKDFPTNPEKVFDYT